MNKELLNSNIKSNVYHISKDRDVTLHKHQKYDEVFYCLKGKGFGVLENQEKELNVGDVFVVRENTLHSLRSGSEMWVASFLIPVVE
jgi:quercetin dioxygenase-like cupin family protein